MAASKGGFANATAVENRGPDWMDRVAVPLPVAHSASSVTLSPIEMQCHHIVAWRKREGDDDISAVCRCMRACKSGPARSDAHLGRRPDQDRNGGAADWRDRRIRALWHPGGETRNRGSEQGRRCARPPP